MILVKHTPQDRARARASIVHLRVQILGRRCTDVRTQPVGAELEHDRTPRRTRHRIRDRDRIDARTGAGSRGHRHPTTWQAAPSMGP